MATGERFLGQMVESGRRFAGSDLGSASGRAEAFEQARFLTTQARAACGGGSEADWFAASVADAQRAVDLLVAGCLDRAAEGVLPAAAAGAARTSLLVFHGADDTPEGLSYLFLVKGHDPARDPAAAREFAAAGFVPALDRLRAELAPFAVGHTWDRATNVNSVEMSWDVPSRGRRRRGPPRDQHPSKPGGGHEE
jgi:hypothetical protein